MVEENKEKGNAKQIAHYQRFFNLLQENHLEDFKAPAAQPIPPINEIIISSARTKVSLSPRAAMFENTTCW